MEARDGFRHIDDGPAGVGGVEQGTEPPVRRQPAHGHEVIDRLAALVHQVQHTEVGVGGEAPVDLDLPAAGAFARLARSVVEEAEVKRLQQLVGPVPDHHDDRGVGLDHGGALAGRRAPARRGPGRDGSPFRAVRNRHVMRERASPRLAQRCGLRPRRAPRLPSPRARTTPARPCAAASVRGPGSPRPRSAARTRSTWMGRDDASGDGACHLRVSTSAVGRASSMPSDRPSAPSPSRAAGSPHTPSVLRPCPDHTRRWPPKTLLALPGRNRAAAAFAQAMALDDEPVAGGCVHRGLPLAVGTPPACARTAALASGARRSRLRMTRNPAAGPTRWRRPRPRRPSSRPEKEAHDPAMLALRPAVRRGKPRRERPAQSRLRRAPRPLRPPLRDRRQAGDRRPVPDRGLPPGATPGRPAARRPRGSVPRRPARAAPARQPPGPERTRRPAPRAPGRRRPAHPPSRTASLTRPGRPRAALPSLMASPGRPRPAGRPGAGGPPAPRSRRPGSARRPAAAIFRRAASDRCWRSVATAPGAPQAERVDPVRVAEDQLPTVPHGHYLPPRLRRCHGTASGKSRIARAGADSAASFSSRRTRASMADDGWGPPPGPVGLRSRPQHVAASHPMRVRATAGSLGPNAPRGRRS